MLIAKNSHESCSLTILVLAEATVLTPYHDWHSLKGLNSAQKSFEVAKVKNRDFAHIPPFPLCPQEISLEKA